MMADEKTTALAAAATLALTDLIPVVVNPGSSPVTKKITLANLMSSMDIASRAWTAYTPVVSQGTATNITKTIAHAVYRIYGDLLVCRLYMTLTSAGQAGQVIFVTLPATVTQVSYSGIGTGTYNTAAARYECSIKAWGNPTATALFFVPLATTTAASILGSDPSFAVANGDTIACSILACLS
jgi:hypothetical protein